MEQSKIIEAKIIWMPFNDILSVVNKITEYLELQLLDVKELTQDFEYYEEKFTFFNCNFILEEPFSECVQEIIHKWCDKEIMDDNHRWLSLKDIETLHNDFVLADKQVEVESFSFGTIVELNHFVEFYSSSKQNSDESLEYTISEIEVTFEHDCKKFSTYFVVSRKEIKVREPNDEIFLPHHFEFDYSNISRILINKVSESDNLEIYLYLKHPPLIYGVEEPQKLDYSDDESLDVMDAVPVRKLNFADCLESDISFSTTLKLEISWYSAWEVVCNFVHSYNNIDCFISPISKISQSEIYPVPKIETDHFNCIYALECILSRNNDIIVQIITRNELTSIQKQLNKYANQDPYALENALVSIHSALGKNNIVIFSNALTFLFKKYNNISDTSNNHCDLVKLRQAVLTPTRLIFLNPLMYLRNEYFKRFETHCAIRLSVRDENFEYLTDNLTEKLSCNKIIPVIETKLKEGFKIGNRHYDILGYNCEMLRDHAVIFYAKDSIRNNAETILSSLLNSVQFNNAITHMKFMEEMFTDYLTTLDVAVDGINITEIYDDNISSKTGKISFEVLKLISDKLDLNYIPSAVTIFYSGSKVTLSKWPSLEGKQIIFKNNENNNISYSSDIQILKISKPEPAYLNRNLVTILSNLNVKDATFFLLQENMLKRIIKCFTEEEMARKLFKKHNLFYINYDELQESFELLQEPFFLLLLQAVTLKQLDDLKTNTQILIPANEGRTMLGIVDETNLLNPGEVFLQCSEDIWNANGKTTIISGLVLIAGNLCMHPSNVQKFEAVDIEELHHIKDCIVFSAKPQKHAMKISYGDEFIVIWMDELLFPCWNHPAKEEKISQPVLNKSTTELLCDYIRNDKLESLYSAYLVSADKDVDGIFSTQCSKIAKIYLKLLKSFYSKELEDFEDFPDKFPDFLDKKLQSNTYLSDKIVGHLFRRCQIMHADFEEFLNSENFLHLIPDGDLDYPGRENFEVSANEALIMYHNKLSDILREYGIRTEGELFFKSFTKLDSCRDNKNYSCNALAIQFKIKTLVNEMRRKFTKEFVKSTSVLNDDVINILCISKYKERIFQKASAWYMATFSQVGRRKYYGLPWTIFDILNNLKHYNCHKSNQKRSLKFQEKLDKLLDLYSPIHCEDDELKAVVKVMHDLIYYDVFKSNKINQNETENLIIEIISHIFEIWLPCSVNIIEKPSVSKILLMLLERMSWLMFEKSIYYPTSSSHFLDSQVIGRLAFEILLNLTCLNNLDYFKINSKTSLMQEAVFRLSVDDDKLSERFSFCGDKIGELMLKWTNITDFQYRFKDDNKFLIIKVIGSKYVINYFKNVILQKDFAEIISSCMSLDTYD